MYHFSIDTKVDFPIPVSYRARELMNLFGITAERIEQSRKHYRARLTVRPGDIIYITGASGAGKSTILNAIYDTIAENDRIRLENIPLPDDRTLFDCIQGPVFQTLETFSKAGLSDVFCLLQRPACLSTGQQFRYRLAYALSCKAKCVVIDEFGSNLDRIMAGVLAYRLRIAAARTGKVFIMASCHEDVLADLQPDILIRIFNMAQMRVYFRDPSRRRDHSNLRADAVLE